MPSAPLEIRSRRGKVESKFTCNKGVSGNKVVSGHRNRLSGGRKRRKWWSDGVGFCRAIGRGRG
ncbi:hypothetical protein JCGZ_15343 [Jatropha curcas]|uniref:Uncharacterized protein n=1 Tax=Jatropha curcas TaxID=180498 RepID=A0A067K8V5_JATCU|nr:hypothetical protein JCGZ_15343 [Jatropha curcas]